MLLLVAPAVLGVGVAAVVATAHVLDAADRELARSRATELVEQVRAELGEGDAADVAISEVLRVTDASLRAFLRGGPLGEGRGTTRPVPLALARLRPGECGNAEDDAGHSFLACAASEGPLEAVAALSTDAHRRVVESLAGWMLAAVVLAVLGAVGAVRLAARSPLVALAALVEWSERLAESDAPPEPAHRAPATPPRGEVLEFDRLGSSFEALVRHLMDALARERATSAHIAHELRTPLTTLRAELEAFSPDHREAALRMLADVDRLARVIDAILVLSAPGTARAGAGVVNVADLARELAPAGAIVDAPDEALVDADAALVELALHNLLENAERHSGAPARAVRVTRTDGGVRLSVVDAGPGLDDAARAHMFDRYWRGGEGAGSGLGLALVRAVAERHGGVAAAAQNANGPGLEVSMTFGRRLGWHSGAEEREK